MTFIVGITCLAYWPALPGGFIFDDDAYLTSAAVIQDPGGLYRIWFTSEAADYYPVTNTTLWVEWRLWGSNPVGYRAANLLLHLAACLLLWTILRRLKIPGAYLAALLFALHPVNVESVAWIAQRKNLLAGSFFLLTILSYLKSDQESVPTAHAAHGRCSRWYWLSLLFFTLAMLSKGSVAVLPAVLLLIAWWQHGRIAKADLLRTAPFFLMAVALTRVNVWFLSRVAENVRDDTLLERLLGAGAVVWFYLAKALVPIHLIFVYPQWRIPSSSFLWWLPLLAAGMLTAILWRRRNALWSKPLWIAWVFFGLAIFPAMGFTNVGFMMYSLVADHYQHIALFGVVALAGAAWSTWHDRTHGAWRSTAMVSAVVLVGILFLATFQRNQVFASPVRLYETTLVDNPNCWMARGNLGMVLSDAGQLPEAIRQFQLALQLKPDYTEAHYNLGNAFFQTERLPEAIVQYQQALQSNPNSVEAHNNLANALAKTGRVQEAVEQYQLTLRLKPGSLKVYSNLTTAYMNLKRPADAIATAQKALELARAQGNTAAVQKIENWLKNHRPPDGDSNTSQ